MSLLNQFKLKHFDLISEDKIDYAKLMVEINGYKNTWFNKRFVFLKSFTKTYQLIEYVKSLDPTLIEMDPDCKIKIPESIEDITFAAMMELQM